uniref:Uncharacterized protein n=1 Tax=Chromera velia CCMP2878 TaxID=1169474 RepID=A0A0K6S773_9ALVE|eukprot:Cvel_19305.t1-p1 / transcript=Cvel_19305.t1 / gene=Cvel_19305 / organism=Chromera_velia_CCMP2878 / gene_product=hypothetical protein / transcript_product=hypothetical protein / location=Cvel_scaffold1654:24487-29111(-) / protein_length=206 / sequence_SO=supercontig / SO=protein_coding / is_pseudo=false
MAGVGLNDEELEPRVVVRSQKARVQSFSMDAEGQVVDPPTRLGSSSLSLSVSGEGLGRQSSSIRSQETSLADARPVRQPEGATTSTGAGRGREEAGVAEEMENYSGDSDTSSSGSSDIETGFARGRWRRRGRNNNIARMKEYFKNKLMNNPDIVDFPGRVSLSYAGLKEHVLVFDTTLSFQDVLKRSRDFEIVVKRKVPKGKNLRR